MTDLVGLLYRADWSRLSLAAEVSVRRDQDLNRTRYEGGTPPPSEAEGVPPPWQLFRELRRRQRAERAWDVATDQLGIEAHQSTLLIRPGRRYREQGENFASGCDGDRSWFAIREDGGWDVEADDGSEPPLPPMLRPSWLLTGYTLEAGEPVAASEPVIVGGREALRVVAFPRPHVWSRGPAGARPLDRVEMLVDLELGILLRHEEILDGRTLSVTELTGVRLDPDPADDDRFAPPGGWDSARRSLSWAPRGPGWEAAKLFTGLAAGGIGALVRSSRSRPFEQATQEEPEADMPPDSEPLPADAPAVNDQVLHLLHDSRDRWATGITATLHQWHDMPAALAQVPDGARRVGFGGLGYLIDAAGERMATLHMVSRLSFDGSGRYRIEPAQPAGDSSRHGGETIVSDGKRQWQLIGGEMVAMPGGLPPHEIAKLLDASWLLEHRLSGGAETSASGRRGYRLRVAANGPIAGQMFSTDEVVADAELGILLRMVCHAGSTPVSRFELRDVVVGGDIRIDIPEGAPTAEGPDDDRAGPDGPGGPGGDPARVASLLARQAAREARSAFRSIFGDR
jgi:hypothetical protein